MTSYTSTVAFSPLRSALVNLPSSISTLLFNSNLVPQSLVLELVWQRRLTSTESKAYVGWTGMTSSSDVMEIDPTFALTLGLDSRQKVSINIKPNPAMAHTVHLEPVDASDWEVVEIHAGFLESWMINQVRAVSLYQSINVYPSATSIAALKVVKIEPENKFAQLSPDSEVVIAPKVRKKNGGKKKTNGQGGNNVQKKKNQWFVLMRGYGVYETDDKDKVCVYGNEQFASQLKGDFVTVSVVKPKSITEKTENPEEMQPIEKIVARFVKNREITEGHVGLSFRVECALNVVGQVGEMIKIENASKENSKSSVTVHPYVIQSGGLKLNEKKENIEVNGPITHLMQIPSSKLLPYGGLLEFNDGDGNGGWMSGNNVECKFGSELVKGESQVLPSYDQFIEPSKQRKLVGIDKVLDEVKNSVMDSTCGTLVYGGRGSGKTAVLEHVQKELNKNLVHTIWFNCAVNGEKPLQFLKDTVKKLFTEAAWYAPSVVIFDSIEKLVPAEQEHRDSSKSSQLSEIFKQLSQQIMNSRPVSVLASTQSKEAMNGLLISGHVFDNSFHIKSPDKDVRELILKEAVASLGTGVEFDLIEVAGQTEGYQASDLWTLAERANHESILRKIKDTSDNSPLNQNDFDKAVADYTPSSLRGVKLQKSSTNWSDIGGLKETKQVLLETLEWPTKYAPIFANCPLRLRSGLLLYGYPGCGKTLLASAVAGQCGLNFISIKGPEILNKYIGASEQSVRELFERAQAAKPCILFFDEFDSIAPKRGHDSTGVTDRVVNQMLTQMDGAEGLDGVYVLAATSRPDLIDSALLRPGRLDKSLICDMPNIEDRLDTIKAVSTKMNIDPEVDLYQVALKTDGYSGADLQAVMYNAYLDAIHDVIDVDGLGGGEDLGGDNNKNSVEYFQVDLDLEEQEKKPQSVADRARAHRRLEKMLQNSQQSNNSTNNNINGSASETDDDSNNKADDVKIKWKHLETSLSDTKPSISAKERRKLETVYKQFVSARDGNMPDGEASKEVGGRTTLM